MNTLAKYYIVDGLGFAASGATLCAFAQRRIKPMRMSAVVANLFFIAYGAAGSYYPVLVLHLILLPLNVVRLIEQTTSLRLGGSQSRSQARASLAEEWLAQLEDGDTQARCKAREGTHVSARP